MRIKLDNSNVFKKVLNEAKKLGTSVEFEYENKQRRSSTKICEVYSISDYFFKGIEVDKKDRLDVIPFDYIYSRMKNLKLISQNQLNGPKSLIK